jgi:predicted phage tail protein
MAPETVVLKTRTVFWRDLAERTISTFIQGALATLVSSQVTSWGALKQAGASVMIGGIAAVLAMAKGLIASKVNNSNSASALGKM